MKRFLDRWQFGILAAAAVCAGLILGGVGPSTFLRAQSTKRPGADVPVNTPEQWFKRIGFLNAAGGCDSALQWDSFNTLRVTDCTDANGGLGNLTDWNLRGLTLTGVPTTQGAAGSDAVLTKTITGIQSSLSVYMPVLTVTVPNAAESATLPIVINASLGPGGSVGANECTATAYGQIVMTRTAGLAAVVTAVALSNTGSACVAGAETIALAYNVTAVSGANSGPQTFGVQILVSGSGLATGDTALIQADLLNSNLNGITVQ